MSQVQDSSDCCINSKLSSSALGYFSDDYLAYFTKKVRRRSPIINRGYYIRFKAMEKVFESWLNALEAQTHFQIISLGAGLDSTYFRLKNSGKLPPLCHYIEIDFEEVMIKKLLYVKEILPSQENDRCLLNDGSDCCIIYHSNEYSMLGINLCDTDTLARNLKLVGTKFSLPTLLVSECSITYMETKDSKALLCYIQQNFPNSVFVAYEQAYPHDAFGTVMVNHFMQVGCQLKCVNDFLDKASQEQRFKGLGWTNCHCITMYEFQSSLPDLEKERINQLEPFDEFEIWHEKCHHYVLVQASQGIFSSVSHLVPCETANLNLDLSKPLKSIRLKNLGSDEIFQRFGHGCDSVSDSVLMMCGGFGVSNKKHKKMDDVVFYDVRFGKCLSVVSEDCFRMYHTVSKLSSNAAVVLGGRKSPRKACGAVLIVHFTSVLDGINLKPSFETLPHSMPLPVWRHSASLVSIKGEECIFVFGGISEDCAATNKSFILSTKSWNWTEVPVTQSTPAPCHSHGSAAYENSVIISGGLTSNERILSTLYLFDLNLFSWSSLQPAGLLPRYSHSSHVWNNHLFLVGGVTSVPELKLGVGVVNLSNSQAFEVDLTGMDPECPLMLWSHSSCLFGDEIAVVGGGGNCFSFGTHFNKGLHSFSCASLL